MIRVLALALLIGCASPSVEYTSTALLDDAGAPACVASAPEACSGARWLAESDEQPLPVMLASWELYEPGLLRVGMGQASPTWSELDVLQLDADEKIAFLLNGGQVIKLQDHPQVGPLWWFGGVSHVWFGNTLTENADLTFQGTNTGTLEERTGLTLTIRGQNMHGAAAAHTARGGNIEVRAGDASSVLGAAATRDPGEVIIGGGRVGYEARGNVAIHDAPGSWCGMEGGLYVRDVRTPPSADPASGGFLFAQGGALYWRGSAGTVTQVAAP